MKPFFSILIPVYNQVGLMDGCIASIQKQSFKDLEVIFVDDGSRDNTVQKVKALIDKDKNVHLLSFSRNFGKEAAIYAGLEKSKGDYVVFMDADLQDPPSLLPEMFKYIDGRDSR